MMKKLIGICILLAGFCFLLNSTAWCEDVEDQEVVKAAKGNSSSKPVKNNNGDTVNGDTVNVDTVEDCPDSFPDEEDDWTEGGPYVFSYKIACYAGGEMDSDDLVYEDGLWNCHPDYESINSNGGTGVDICDHPYPDPDDPSIQISRNACTILLRSNNKILRECISSLDLVCPESVVNGESDSACEIDPDTGNVRCCCKDKDLCNDDVLLEEARDLLGLE